MVDSSINNPTNPLIGLSGQIPDYAAGNNEYSNLTLDGSRQEWKVEQIYIVATISIMVIIILVVVILIVRHRGL